MFNATNINFPSFAYIYIYLGMLFISTKYPYTFVFRHVQSHIFYSICLEKKFKPIIFAIINVVVNLFCRVCSLKQIWHAICNFMELLFQFSYKQVNDYVV